MHENDSGGVVNQEYLDKMTSITIEILKQLSSTKDPVARRGVLTLLLTLCRNMEDVAPRNASKSAQQRADSLSLGDLRQYHFDDGGRFPGGRKNSRLHWEHWKPASDLRRDLLNLYQPSHESVKQILEKSRVCWILLEENDVLNSLGHRINRKDPEKCYREANIDLAYDW